MHSFTRTIKIIGVNPYVSVPDKILHYLFDQAGKQSGPIPIRGTIGGKPYTQTLVRYSGEWRLYINTKMLKNSPRHVGESITLTIDYDPSDRTLPIHPALQQALAADEYASKTIASLTPSHQKEINRYISNLKTDVKIQHNVQRAIDYLHGKGRFVGR